MRIITEVKKMDLPKYNKKKIEEYQEVCPICDCICEPGAMLFCDHYIGVFESGELIWIPTEKIELFEIVRNFCAELDDLFVFHRERYTTVLNLMFDQDLTIPEIDKFKSFISTLEACEFSLESYISDNDIFNFSKVRHTSNLFHGVYTNYPHEVNELAQTIPKKSALFNSLLTILKAGYQVTATYDLNREETEEDGLRAGALRILKVQRMFQNAKKKTK